MTLLIIMISAVIGMVVYFVPSVVAFKRNAVSKWGIFFVNLFFGWTLLIWIVTLIWACEGRK